MTSIKHIIPKENKSNLREVSQGDCVYIKDKEDIFQVIGVDYRHQKCWVRRWPLLAHGSPVFEISIQQVSSASSNN